MSLDSEYKELITLAAKAMGYEGKWFLYPEWKRDFFSVDGLGEWSPLTPADRAAMCDQLEIDVIWNRRSVKASCVFEGDRFEALEPYTTNKSLACSLACLRVAAEIGRRM